ncbi:hypothetical protein PV396_37350 [Streptomyces sp. ME02-8801-2C]|uniref:hypothetical protein n=1 Tax=Streptomyces sp. ME02-8801-2C TaxID=3028680 RepID=UPI0029A76FFA|nr:hypothetical protein [Streptomyces sp. ME02-8801-2C]MDX3457556.1 hypothetical protein [Streptomyces sp. ME02-8801-2C]
MELVVRFLIAVIGGLLCLFMTCLVAASGFLFAVVCIMFACTVGVLAGVLGGKGGRAFAMDTARTPIKSLRATGRGVGGIWEFWSKMVSSDD